MIEFLQTLIAQGDAAAESGSTSLFELAQKGGPMMIPIGICSLVALGVVFERLVTLRRANVIPAGFMMGLKKTLDENDGDRETVLAYCNKSKSPIGRICAAGLNRPGRSIDTIEKRITEAGEHEILRLRKYLRSLAVIASISPLLGLTGTIFGMIRAFQTVALSGEALGKTEQLAEGIYEAMVTTAAGLLVAIPALIFYNLLVSKIDRLVAEMDRVSIEFAEEFVASNGHGGPEAKPLPIKSELRAKAEA
eukprot:TRINITY_DN49239_c0_g1_i2.p2 TRINITY_DN49239_c0_g1~~TRINITY_DN49239_c0_g1_i2.p2  ORF type:complete len:250 (-),score=29.65 TRINITY_DN49239_c0_g1_i2:104-853(-)